MNPAPAPEPTGVRPHRSLAWRLILPIPLVVIAGIATLWVLVPRMIVANATEEAAAQGQQIVEQFKAVRTYYTTNVVNKVLKEGTFKAASDHAGNDKAIPLPATMIHDLGALLAKQDTTLTLYSRFPFANRQDRKLDEFQQKAWEIVTGPEARRAFDLEPAHLSLRSIRERVRVLAGQVTVESNPGRGARIEIPFPLGSHATN